VLLDWWIEQNSQGRHIWPGNYTSRITDDPRNSWPVSEILYQIRVTRGYAGATGNIHFSMKPLMQNRQGISDALTRELYDQPAVIPSSPWLPNIPPGQPLLHVDEDENSDEIQLTWTATGLPMVWLWVVQTRIGDRWTTHVLPGRQTSFRFKRQPSNQRVDSVAVSAVNRYKTVGVPAVVELSE
jgi:hypothetical protein